MLIIHNMYFPHGYQYTYIYFRVGVKAVAGGQKPRCSKAQRSKSPDALRPKNPKKV